MANKLIIKGNEDEMTYMIHIKSSLYFIKNGENIAFLQSLNQN